MTADLDMLIPEYVVRVILDDRHRTIVIGPDVGSDIVSPFGPRARKRLSRRLYATLGFPITILSGDILDQP